MDKNKKKGGETPLEFDNSFLSDPIPEKYQSDNCPKADKNDQNSHCQIDKYLTCF